MGKPISKRKAQRNMLRYATQFKIIENVIVEKRSPDNWVVIINPSDKIVIDADFNTYNEPLYQTIYAQRDSCKTELGKKTQFPLDAAFELAYKWYINTLE